MYQFCDYAVYGNSVRTKFGMAYCQGNKGKAFYKQHCKHSLRVSDTEQLHKQ